MQAARETQKERIRKGGYDTFNGDATATPGKAKGKGKKGKKGKGKGKGKDF